MELARALFVLTRLLQYIYSGNDAGTYMQRSTQTCMMQTYVNY